MSEATLCDAIPADTLLARRGDIAASLDGLVGEGRSLALQAALGDRAAARRAAQNQARSAALSAQLAALDTALARTASDAAAAAAAEAAQQRRDQEQALAILLQRRLDLAAAIEAALRRLLPQIVALDAAGSAAEAAARSLGEVVPAFWPLGREATGGRLAEFMAGLGYDSWLPLARPEIRPAITDLRAAEATAQALHRQGVARQSGVTS